MTVVCRTIASSPARTAGETWRVIEELASAGGSTARRELESVIGAAATLIAEGLPKEHPIVFAGNGPRLRIYCAYGDDAVLGEQTNESALNWVPTEGDWRVYMPCHSEDLDWLTKELARRSSRALAYDSSEGISEQVQGDKDNRFKPLTVNVEGFLKP
jgi:hypothetical protein